MQTIHYWWWFGFALLMLGLEVIVPTGTLFLWWGLAGVATGLVSLIFPELSWQIQSAGFSLFSVLSVLIWWKWWRNPAPTDQPFLNQRGAQYQGRVFTLSEPIVNGYGKIHVDDTQWKVQGSDCPVGGKVKVIGVNGVVLIVETVA